MVAGALILRPGQLAPTDRAALDRVSALPFDRWAGFVVLDIDHKGAPPLVVVTPAGRIPHAVAGVLARQKMAATDAVAEGARALFAYEGEAEFRREAARITFKLAGDRPSLSLAIGEGEGACRAH